MPKSEKLYDFIIEKHYGTVSSYETKVLGRVKAADAQSAIKPFLTEEYKNWNVQKPESRFSVTYYNPRDAISDGVNRISARCIDPSTKK